jgi:hypothetical protein
LQNSAVFAQFCSDMLLKQRDIRLSASDILAYAKVIFFCKGKKVVVLI